MRKVNMIAFALIGALALSGCSTASALSGLFGSKPEVSAQVGAENTKQTVGLNNKVDTSSEVKTTVQDSNVGKVDSSNGKKTSASSITASTIKADKIEIRNSDGGEVAGYIALFCAVLALLLFGGLVFRIRKCNKGA